MGQVDADHRELERAISGLSPEALCQPVLGGQWSVKDCLAHITFWEGLLLSRLEPALRGEPAGPDPPELEGLPAGAWTQESLDEVNRRVFESRRSASPDEVMESFDRSFERVRVAIASLEDVTESSPLTTALGRSPAAAVAPDTHEHYAEHAAQIRAWRDAGAV